MSFKRIFPATLTALFLATPPLTAGATDPAGRLYATACASCHGDHGQGSDAAPGLIGKSAANIHFMLDTGRMPAAAPSINEIHRPPAFTPEQIASLVRYVQSFSQNAGSGSVSLRVTAGDPNRGRGLFAENCAQCHGASGDGASIGYDNVAPSLAMASRLQIAEAVRVGPGVMPRFGNDVLSGADVSDIAAYVIALRSSKKAAIDAGGLGLSHVGPVAEGFVAWLFGLGALVLFVRRIGEAGASRARTLRAKTPEAQERSRESGSAEQW